MSSKKNVQHVYLVGAKSLGAYGGYETFVRVRPMVMGVWTKANLKV